MGKFSEFARIAEVEFSDIILSTHYLDHKLRIYLVDKSFIDFYFTSKTKRLRFALHWERRYINKTIFRLDNTPDKKWKKIKSFPIHFHYKHYEKVVLPPFSISNKNNLKRIFRNFLNFVRKKLKP
jgi:hypothetical protein